MNLADFKKTISDEKPPEVSEVLQALWYDAKGDWQAAHQIVQEISSAEAAWVHAYLHRKEGDQPNAAYWYNRAHKPVCAESLDSEWHQLVSAFLA